MAPDHAATRVPWKIRLQHLTWANWTLPMSTGGLALLLAKTPHQFTGLNTIGKIVYIWDLVIYLTLLAGLSYRFSSRRGSFKASLTHPTEALFFATFLLSTVNVLSCAQAYGAPASGPWLGVALRVMFWIYAAVAFIAAVVQYNQLFSETHHLTIQSMTPAWILPAFSAMLVGTLAATISPDQPPDHRISIIVAGVAFQGFGWCVSFLMYALFINRLMQYGLPAPNLRPGMFIAVGPPAFTTLALISLSNGLPSDIGYFAAHPTAASILQVLALFVGIFIWLLGFFFFCVAALSTMAGRANMSFHLVWWAMVFPNVGFTLATAQIGAALESEGILWVASGMTIVVVVAYIFVLGAQIRAIWLRQIYMPGKDEDKDEYKADDEMHGISMPLTREEEKHGSILER